MKKTFMDLQVGDKVWVLMHGAYPEEATVVDATERQAIVQTKRRNLTVKGTGKTIVFKSKAEMLQHIVDDKIAARERAEARLMEAQRAVDQARDKLAEAKQEQA